MGTAKVHAVSPGLGKEELVEGRRTNLWDDGMAGQDLVQHHSPSFVLKLLTKYLHHVSTQITAEILTIPRTASAVS